MSIEEPRSVGLEVSPREPEERIGVGSREQYFAGERTGSRGPVETPRRTGLPVGPEARRIRIEGERLTGYTGVEGERRLPVTRLVEDRRGHTADGPVEGGDVADLSQLAEGIARPPTPVPYRQDALLDGSGVVHGHLLRVS